VSDRVRPLDLSNEQLTSLPIDVLGVKILESLQSTPSFTLHNVLNSWRHAGLDGNGPQMTALVEACEWLSRKGLVASNPQGSPYNGFITRLGYEVLDRGVSLLGAIESLGDGLHPAVQSVRSQFLLGEYELAAFAAMRSVEIRVRALGSFSDADIGTPMMRNAFHAQTGPLRDPSAEGGERQGLSDLFAGAFSVFKNPTSHRVVTFGDPTEAAEIIGLASLLHRILDRRASDAE
jgi:uncharacterized protein (TIGR02391 family)